MQLVTAVIRPHALDDVKDALREVGVAGLTVSEVRGFGRQGGHTETYRGAEYKVEFLPKVKVEVLVRSEDADRVVHAIMTSAQSRRIGDGKIWVVDVERAVRIRTGEENVEAV